MGYRIGAEWGREKHAKGGALAGMPGFPCYFEELGSHGRSTRSRAVALSSQARVNP
jgi:hypothetical protein